jgi:hypothetical protein
VGLVYYYSLCLARLGLATNADYVSHLKLYPEYGDRI